jgi:hypothetical protein
VEAFAAGVTGLADAGGGGEPLMQAQGGVGFGVGSQQHDRVGVLDGAGAMTLG